MPSRGRTIVFALFALGNLANGLWMLVSPAHWYINLPANVPGTGPLNEHFVRDIGCVFTLIGLALGWAAFVPRARLAAMVFAAGFSFAHAVVHVYDTTRGLLPPSQWMTDLIPIHLPSVVMLAIAMQLAWEHRQQARA